MEIFEENIRARRGLRDLEPRSRHRPRSCILQACKRYGLCVRISGQGFETGNAQEVPEPTSFGASALEL